MDHLLAHAKINSFLKKDRQRKAIGQRGTRKKTSDIQAGMSSLYTHVHLDILVEEVVESVFAGFNFQKMSLAQLKLKGEENADVGAMRRLDARKFEDPLNFDPVVHGDLFVGLDIEPVRPWLTLTQPGAIRRLLLNLFGNSLKYTAQGSIRISMRLEKPSKKSDNSMLHLTVVDTGKGISNDFLRNRLFVPFSQEDALAPGTGLGLSLANQIANSLDGDITVESKVAQGTTITVNLPMKAEVPDKEEDKAELEKEFDEQVRKLSGLRVKLEGFVDDEYAPAVPSPWASPASELGLMENLCRHWLEMTVISPDSTESLSPDLVVCDEKALGGLAKTSSSSMPPTVVVCQNVLTAHQLSSAYKDRLGIFEFIAQP